jgi:hypothetical protein
MEMMISEKIATVKGLEFASVNALAETDRIPMKDAYKMRFLVRLEAGAGTTCSVKVIEHDAAVAGNSNDVVLTTKHIVRVDGSDAELVDASGVADIAVADLDTDAGLLMVEVNTCDMTDGFDHLSLEIAAPGAARILGVVCELETKVIPGYHLSI